MKKTVAPPSLWKQVPIELITKQWSMITAWTLLGVFLCLWAYHTSIEYDIVRGIYFGSFSNDFFNWLGMALFPITLFEVVLYDISHSTGKFEKFSSAIRKIVNEMIQGLLGMVLLMLGNYSTLTWLIWKEEGKLPPDHPSRVFILLVSCIMLFGLFGTATSDAFRESIIAKSKWSQRAFCYALLAIAIAGMWEFANWR